MKLTEYRKKFALTQGQIADSLNCDPATVCRYEKGTRLPNLRMIRKIKAVTGGAVAEDDWATEAAA